MCSDDVQVRTLEARLSQSESLQHELSFRLNSVVSAVWRTARAGCSADRISRSPRRTAADTGTVTQLHGSMTFTCILLCFIYSFIHLL